MKKIKVQEYIVTGIAFIIFFAIISYKLTNAGLWYDETVEYWYSKYLVGSLPWADGMSNMYERIVSTYQPPLFNILLYFWLKIWDTEWWIRMFGVVMGVVGAVGIYKTIRLGTESVYKASVSVILYATIVRLTYYWQEVAEYALMLGLLSWTVYFFLRLMMRKPGTKEIILFVIFCILPVYSQYGAVFPVAAFVIIAFVKIMKDQDTKQIITLTGSYAVAAIFAALPLYLLFLRPQMLHESADTLPVSEPFSLYLFIYNYLRVLKWNFTYEIGEISEIILILAAAFMIVVAFLYLIRGKEVWMKYLLVSNMICYILYSVAVFGGFYSSSYGTFGSRYNLFLIPLWFATGLLLLDLFLREFSGIIKCRYASQVAAILGCVVIVGLLCWGYTGWTSIAKHWSKENIRGVADTWISNSGYETDTIVYYAADSGFSYYVTHDDAYTDSMFDYVIFQEFDRDMTEDYYKEWVDSVYEEWPSSLYLVQSHARDDWNTLVSVFTDAGYTSSNVYGGALLYLELEQ